MRFKYIYIGLSVLGLLDSIYLSWLKLTNNTAMCANIGDCDAVNSSVYAEIYGIPIAILGALAYLMIIGVVLFGERIFGESDGLILFGLSLVGFLYSAYLTYIEVAVIHAICPYCVVSALLISTIFVLSIIDLSTRSE